MIGRVKLLVVISQYNFDAMKFLACSLALILIAGCGPVRLTVDDAVVSPQDNTLRCSAYLQREPIFGIRHFSPGSRVDFIADGKKIASVPTGADGRAEVSAPFVPGSANRLDAVAAVDGTTYRGSSTIYDWDDHRTIVVIDIDRTISRTDFDHLVLVDGEDERSTPLSGSRRAMETLARDCHFIYLTARPRFLLDKTRMWLLDEEFPVGPVIASPGLREAIRRTEYKIEILAVLRSRWPTVLIGIGNSESDEEAYEKSGLLTLLVNQKHVHTDHPRTYRFHNWKALARFFETNRDLLADPDKLTIAIKDDTIASLLHRPADGPATQPAPP